jgi:methylthioribulose-1-phosphate dehydratase
VSAGVYRFCGGHANVGSYVWGDNVHKAKTQCERYDVGSSRYQSIMKLLTVGSIDYILQLAVEMKKLGLPWTKDAPKA